MMGRRKAKTARDVQRFLSEPTPALCAKPMRSCGAPGCKGCDHSKGHRGSCWCVCAHKGRFR